MPQKARHGKVSMETIAEQLNGRKILIWGHGREGKSTERYIRGHCSPASVTVFEGKKDGFDEDAYDVIIKSPGIVMPEDDPKVTSQTELFLSMYRNQTIGITGTKGKSTTSALLYTVLKACGRDALLVGNIGQPCLDDTDKIRPDTVVVYEMSCHQLEHCHISPAVGVILNLFEEHLDHYGTLETYFRAKSHIASYMREGDIYYRGFNVPVVATKATVLRVGADSAIRMEQLPEDGLPLPRGPLTKKTALTGSAPARKFDLAIEGTHNQYNAAIVYHIAVRVLGCDPLLATRAIESFQGLPHRLQKVKTDSRNRRWYDDSISTIPEAAIGAAGSIEGEKTILLGGMDRGIDYDSLEEFIRNHPEIRFVFGYASGSRMLRELASGSRIMKENAAGSGSGDGGRKPVFDAEHANNAEPVTGEELSRVPVNCYWADDLGGQIRKAAEITPDGGAVILSPASPSYGYFKNFEERGDRFRELIAGQ